MVDPTFQLGRDVPTAREVLEVIRPQLRLAAVTGPALDATFSNTPAPPDPAAPDAPIVCIMEGGDRAAFDAVFDALVADALRNVQEWATDVAKVYDKDKLKHLVAAALNEVFNGEPSDAVLDVLDLDEGVCESIGMALSALAGAESPQPSDPVLVGVAARYFQKV